MARSLRQDSAYISPLIVKIIIERDACKVWFYDELFFLSWFVYELNFLLLMCAAF